MAAINTRQKTMTLDTPRSELQHQSVNLQEFLPKGTQETKRTKRLTRSEIERLRTGLLAKRNEVLRTLSGIQDGMCGSDTGDMGPMDLADKALVSHTVEENNGLLGSEGRVLEEIDEVQERIQESTYGLCQKCMRPIAKKRLQAIPWVAKSARLGTRRNVS